MIDLYDVFKPMTDPVQHLLRGGGAGDMEGRLDQVRIPCLKLVDILVLFAILCLLLSTNISPGVCLSSRSTAQAYLQ